ncbi:uncharacterized protein LOC125698776 isoform X2 [Lagopus muta]|uniref:uncharacterized protein LOC125698776 isoform X2 n=1 Tax=Lagopus muta TaxID=64668 RepID=UPI00209EFA00|nr:uncharacterized protein LOC125698776 isoform X2 [Lagopus muta]
MPLCCQQDAAGTAALTPVLLADHGSPAPPAAGAVGQHRLHCPQGAAEHLGGLAAWQGWELRGRFQAVKGYPREVPPRPAAGRGCWPEAGPCGVRGMGGEQQEGGRAAAGQGRKHPAPLQLGSERKDERPVPGANQLLFSPQLLLPFTMCQQATVEERAVACIGRLLAFTNSCSSPKVGALVLTASGTASWLPSRSPPVSPASRLAHSLGWAPLPRSAVRPRCLSPQPCSCFMEIAAFQHKCQENQRFPILGKLAGHLILSCTSTDERTRDEAMKAVRQLFTLIPIPRWSLEQQRPKVPRLWESQLALLHQEASHDNRAIKIFQVLLKYLAYPETVNILLCTIESMTAPSLHSTELAAHMVDVLAAKTCFPPRQVWKIMKTIYNSLPSIRDRAARKSLGRALLVLASKFPKQMVSSLLVCSPTCTRAAVTMWREMLSKPPVMEKVLQELLQVLINHSEHHASPFMRDRPRVLALAAARTLPEILQLPLVLKKARAIFPKLFLALLLQVSFTTKLTQQEVEIFWEAHQQNPLTPIRCRIPAPRCTRTRCWGSRCDSHPSPPAGPRCRP